MTQKFRPFRGDRPLWVIIWALIAFSFLIIFSSTAQLVSSNLTYYLSRQSLFIVFGVIFMLIAHLIDFKVYAKYTRTILYISIFLVVLAYLVGHSINGANRWINITDSISFQPSEMLKVALMAYLAVQLGQRVDILPELRLLPSVTPRGWRRHPHRNHDIYNNATKPLVLPIFVSFAVIFPSDLSTALMLFAVSIMVLIVAKVRIFEILKLLALITILMAIAIPIMNAAGYGRSSTWQARIDSYIAPIIGDETEIDHNDQDNQALIAISSGGIWGKGPGKSTQRSLANAQSDYAYAFTLEEYGILGGFLVGFLFLLAYFRAGVIARQCRSGTNSILVIGLSTSITFQAFISMLVSVGWVPVTGQPLPLISVGGSSIVCTCIALGMILSVSRQNKFENALEARMIARGEEVPADFGCDVIKVAASTSDNDGNYGTIDDRHVDHRDQERNSSRVVDRPYGHAEDRYADRSYGHAEDRYADRPYGHAEDHYADRPVDRSHGGAEDRYADRPADMPISRSGTRDFILDSQTRSSRVNHVDPEVEDDDSPFEVVDRGDSSDGDQNANERDVVNLY